ncbi:MAG TPA: methyltransferase domain-containing protein [Methylomirabilota bacterium]|jgi:ubiquinone/menaquinone biosynthesis C-methylase UbiE|nr:methyltransferase domain-containing protein [Methylomirabilota bacterium]
MSAIREAWLGYKHLSFELLALAEGDHVLDVGCGTGEDARAIAGLVRGVAVTGLDVDEARVGEARAQTLGLPRPVDFQVGDVYALEFEDASFDACRADRVFHHLTDPRKALGEMARVTRPGGRLVVSDVDYDTLVVEGGDPGVTRRILEHHADRMESGRVGRQLPGLFADAGLDPVTVHPYAAVVREDDEEVLRLRDKAARAVEAGRIGAAEAAAWEAALERAQRTGRFLCAVTVFTVRGYRR